MKRISRQNEWSRVSQELQRERLKLKSYDETLLADIGNVRDMSILDYGCGPGVLASALQTLGADVKVFDISGEMREIAGEMIGNQNVYSDVREIPKQQFDAVICNLVLCIVPEDEVRSIVANTRHVLKPSGLSYEGFCNPGIFDVPESNLDLRFPTGHSYDENHAYRKIKKEGGYEIVELHRPNEWYEKMFDQGGLTVVNKLFTPEYELKGRKIQDFIIYKLQKSNLLV